MSQSNGMDWGKQEEIDPALVVVDHSYQRGKKDSLIIKIGSNFNEKLFGRPVCFRRDNGMLYAIDGQQRIAGAVLAKIKKVPVITFDLPDITSEAQVFVAINEARVGLTSIERYRGRLAAKDKTALEIQRAAETAGFSIAAGGGSGGNSSSRSIQAIGAMTHAHALLGEQGLVQMLTVMRESWPDDRTALNVKIIRILAEIIDGQINDGTYNRAKLVQALSKTSPAQILRTSEEIHFQQGTSKSESVRRAFKKLARV